MLQEQSFVVRAMMVAQTLVLEDNIKRTEQLQEFLYLARCSWLRDYITSLHLEVHVHAEFAELMWFPLQRSYPNLKKIELRQALYEPPPLDVIRTCLPLDSEDRKRALARHIIEGNHAGWTGSWWLGARFWPLVDHYKEHGQEAHDLSIIVAKSTIGVTKHGYHLYHLVRIPGFSLNNAAHC